LGRSKARDLEGAKEIKPVRRKGGGNSVGAWDGSGTETQ
jgi:hypothetical protein